MATNSMDATVVRSLGSSSVTVNSIDNVRGAAIPLHRVSDSVLYLVTQTPSRKLFPASAGLYKQQCMLGTCCGFLRSIYFRHRVSASGQQRQPSVTGFVRLITTCINLWRHFPRESRPGCSHERPPGCVPFFSRKYVPIANSRSFRLVRVRPRCHHAFGYA